MSPPPALSPQRFRRVAQCYGVPAVHRGRWQARRTSTVRAYPLAMLRGSRSEGHFLWVTFLLGQQKKSDSSVGRRSKRPPRRRHPGGSAEARKREKREKRRLRLWMTSFAVVKRFRPAPG